MDRQVDEPEQNKKTLDSQEFDLKDELKKVLGLKSTKLRSIVNSTIETQRKESIKASRYDDKKTAKASTRARSNRPSEAKIRLSLNLINAYNRNTFNNLKIHSRKQNFYSLGKVGGLASEPDSERPFSLH